ncbi:MAG: ATP-binding protein [Dissulfurispiraceae bacterium]|jgi:signal transduction histidine kinase|nr:ATP-binding protein [Dissulfurispiraceae bacterium]
MGNNKQKPDLKTLELLYNIQTTLLSPDIKDTEKLQQTVMMMAEFLEAGKCSIMMINNAEMTLDVVASTNSAIIGLKRNLDEVSISTRALLDDEPFTADGKRRSYFSPLEKSMYHSEYSISIPIKYFDNKIGVVNITDFRDIQGLSPAQETSCVDIITRIAPLLYADHTARLLVSKVSKLQNANAKLIELDRMKTALTHFIVHDLKGPIATITANLDMLSYENLTTEQFECLNLAIEDIFKMQRMVMNILDVLKLEEGKITIYREETDIHDMAKREAMSVKNLMARRNLQMHVKGESYSCYIDENLINRTISNLLINAIEHARESTTIILSTEHDTDRQEIIVKVIDEGPGIPDEMKEKIFDKYFQINENNKQRKATTGLGLNFCKLVVEAHGGRLFVEDRPGGGSVFVFTLPERPREVV